MRQTNKETVAYLELQGNKPHVSELERQLVLFPIPEQHDGALLQRLNLNIFLHNLTKNEGITHFRLKQERAIVSFPFSVLSQFIDLQNGPSNTASWPVVGQCSWADIEAVMAVNGRIIQYGILGDECPNEADGYSCGPFSFIMHDIYHLIRYSWTTPNFRALTIRIHSLTKQWQQKGLISAERAALFSGNLLDNEWHSAHTHGLHGADAFNKTTGRQISKLIIDIIGHHPLFAQHHLIPFLLKECVTNPEEWQRETFGLTPSDLAERPTLEEDAILEGLQDYYEKIIEKCEYSKTSLLEDAEELFPDNKEEQSLYISEQLDERAQEIATTTEAKLKSGKSFFEICDDLII